MGGINVKLKIITFVVILVALVSFAVPQMDWGRVYQMPGIQEIFYVKATNDGFYAIGSSNETGNNENAIALKFDKFGNLVSKSEFGGAYSDWALWAFEDSRKDMVLVGATNSFSEGFDYYLAKVSPVYWETYIPKLGNDKASAGVDVEDGYIIVGYAQDPYDKSNSNYKGYMVKIDKDAGNVIWYRWLSGADTFKDVKPLGIEKVSDGFVISGVVFDYDTGISSLYVVKTDFEANEIWSKVFTGQSYGRAFEVKEFNDEYYVVGYTGDLNGAGFSDIYVVKFSWKGDLLWEKTFGQKGSDHGYSIKISKNGNMYIGGYITNPKTNNVDAVLLVYDKDGNEIYNKAIGGKGRDVVYSLDITDDGDIYMVGYSDSKDFGADISDVLIIKFSDILMHK